MRWQYPFAAMLAASLLAGAVLAGTVNAQADDAGTGAAAIPSWRVPAANAANGARLAEPCLACHGAGAMVLDPPAPRLRHMRASYIFFALRDYQAGRRDNELMQAVAQPLTEQDMRDLSQVLAGDMFDRPPPVRSDLPGYAISQRQCGLCHGETGIGELEGMPVLTGQDPAYLAAALRAYRDGTRSNAAMRDVAAGLTDQDIAHLAEFYAAHEWLEHLP